MNDKPLQTGWLKPAKHDSYKFEEVELGGKRFFNFHILDKSGKTDHTLSYTERMLESILHLNINAPDIWIAFMNLHAETSIIKRLFEMQNLVTFLDERINDDKSGFTMKDLRVLVDKAKKRGNDENQYSNRLA